jgi:outer membrane lipoprotein LolB
MAASAKDPSESSPPPAPASASVTGQWEGRLSLKLGAFGQASSTGSQMAFELDVRNDQGTLSLSTPLGTRMAMVRWQAPGAPDQTTAQLETSDGIQAFDSLEGLTQQLLGEALPLQAMLHWLQGHPSPMLPFEPGEGQSPRAPRAFTQAGWQVDATDLQEGKLNAFRTETATQRSVTLRLRLDL